MSAIETMIQSHNPPGHNLIIQSLRDLQAVCSCGGWSLVCIAHAHQSDEQLREVACYQHAFHLSNVKRREAARETTP